MSSTGDTAGRDSLELAVGRIVKPHGIRGELVVDPLTDSPELRFAAGCALEARRRGGRTAHNVTVASVRPHGGRMLLSLREVASRDEAEQWRGVLLVAHVDPDEAAEDPEEFHDHQLEGLRVDDRAGRRLGEVREVVHTPAGELLAVRTPDEAEVLVPFVAEIVPELDLERGYVVVAPPEGLFGAE
ncbi:ribosome maturation factor RimM [Salinifilum aidingensis]